MWWGHKIPAYQCKFGGRSVWVIAENSQEARAKALAQFECPPEDLAVVQDEDVLDTWFSSALLPFSSLSRSEKVISSEPVHVFRFLQRVDFPGETLPTQPDGDGPRHPVLLGGEDGDAGRRIDRGASVQEGPVARHHLRCPRQEDVEESGKRRRPGGCHLREEFGGISRFVAAYVLA